MILPAAAMSRSTSDIRAGVFTWSCSPGTTVNSVPTASATTSLSTGVPSSRFMVEDIGDLTQRTGSLKEIFTTHVMCDYTPRVPKQFATSRWATLEELVSKLQQHAPAEVTKLDHQNLRQMITEWYKHHPAFENLPFSAWIRRLKNNAPQTLHTRNLTFKFCFEHTPGGLGR